MLKFYIMIGNVGSGKTTWIKDFILNHSRENWAVVSKDAFRRMLGGGIYVFDPQLEPLIDFWAKQAIQRLLLSGFNVICDETNMDKETRAPYLDLIEIDPMGISVYAVVAPRISKEEALKRKSDPSVSYGHSLEEWAEVWERKAGKYEPPTSEEGFDGIYYV
jgi:predicted kinase